MKRFFVISILIIAFFVSSTGYGEEILRMATSAQIAEAFGLEVVKEFEQKHNIMVKIFICSSDNTYTDSKGNLNLEEILEKYNESTINLFACKQDRVYYLTTIYLYR